MRSVFRVLAVALIGACSSSAPPPVSEPRPVAAIDAGVDAPADAARLAPAPDAAPITSLEVLQMSARSGRTFYWRVPTDPVTCQDWTLQPDDDGDGATGILIRHGLSFRYEIGADVKITGAFFGAQQSMPSCEDHLRPTSDDSTVLAFDDGVWYWGEEECERDTRMMPPGCTALVASTTAVTTKPADVLAKAIKKRRSVYLLYQHDDGYACSKYTFGKSTLEHRDSGGKSGWEYQYEPGADGHPGTLSLAGWYSEDAGGSGMAIGDFDEYFVHVLTSSIVLVGGYPWFLDEAACTGALAATTPGGA